MTDASEGESESTWTRLRRRKVVQWGVAYAAGAWGFLQGLQYVSDAFTWPPQLRRVAILALLVGLPIVLVVAWYHGDKGQQRVSRVELVILTLLFLAGGALFWHYQRAADVQTAQTSAPPALANDRSIAVLPFVNISPDREQEYFADGISEELLNLLAQIPELRVIARTSSFSFKGKDVGIAEIARRLNVAHVLEGSVRRSGNTLRITAQLIRASDSSHLWSQTFDRQMTDVFAIQDEIAGAVVEQLKIRLIGGPPTAGSANPKAYSLYLQARQVGRQFTKAAMEQSVVLYQQALQVDPAYQAAWVGLAEAYFYQATQGVRPLDEGVRLVRETVARALALNTNCAGAYAMLGRVALVYDRDLTSAALQIERALSLDPTNLDVLNDAAVLTRRLGRLQQAIAIGEYQVARDPVNEFAYENLSKAYRYAGRLDESIAALKTVMILNPANVGERMEIGEILLEKNDARSALAQAELLPAPPESSRLYVLSMAYHALGRTAEADAALQALIRNYERTLAFSIACVYAFRGETDSAFVWLEKAAQYKDVSFGALPVYPFFGNLRPDPRWLPFLRKHGMAPEQLAAIKFDIKVPQ